MVLFIGQRHKITKSAYLMELHLCLTYRLKETVQDIVMMVMTIMTQNFAIQLKGQPISNNDSGATNPPPFILRRPPPQI